MKTIDMPIWLQTQMNRRLAICNLPSDLESVVCRRRSRSYIQRMGGCSNPEQLDGI